MDKYKYLNSKYREFSYFNLSTEQFKGRINRFFSRKRLKKNIIDRFLKYEHNLLKRSLNDIRNIYSSDKYAKIANDIYINLLNDNIDTIDDLVLYLTICDQYLIDLNRDISVNLKKNKIMKELNKLDSVVNNIKFINEKSELEELKSLLLTINSYDDYLNNYDKFKEDYSSLITHVRKVQNEEPEDNNKSISFINYVKNKKKINYINKKVNDYYNYYEIADRPLLYFEELKLNILENRNIDDQKVVEICEYINSLKEEFIYMFKSSLNPNDKDRIVEMIRNIELMVNRKIKSNEYKIKKIA